MKIQILAILGWNNLSSPWIPRSHQQCFGQREPALLFSGFDLPAPGSFLPKSFPSNVLRIGGFYGRAVEGQKSIVFKAWLCLIFLFKSEFWDSHIDI